MNNRRIVRISLAVIFIFVVFPILTNFIMNFSIPIKVNQHNIWLGYYSSYFGALFVVFIGGLFTFLGVKLTIRDQRVTNDEKLKRENRPFLQLGEIYNVGLNLSNLQETNGYIIITDYYRAAIDNNITDGNYNFIQLNNFGPVVAINCDVNITSMLASMPQ